MQVRRGFLGWGVLLILAGAIPLAVRAGAISTDQLGRVWDLWPLILIGVGVGLILSRTRFALVGGLIVAATFGIMVGGLLSAGASGFWGGTCGSDDAATAFPGRDGSLATTADVRLQLSCGDLTVGIAEGTGWHLEGTDTTGAGPTIDASESKLDIRSPDSHGTSWFGFGHGDTWRVSLPAATSLGLDLRLNAGRASVDLGDASVGGLTLQLNAGSAAMDLGSVAAIRTLDVHVNAGSLVLTLPSRSMTGTIQVNAGAVRLCAPAGVGLKLDTGQSIISSYDYAGHGLVQVGSTWTTPGFETAAVRIELVTSANAGSFTLDPPDGCE